VKRARNQVSTFNACLTLFAAALCVANASAKTSSISDDKSVAPSQPSPTDHAVSPAIDAALLKELEAVDASVATIKDLRASFEQRKTSALLRKPLVSSGELFCKGDVVLWKTTRPRSSSMRVDATEIRLFYPDDKLVEIYPVDGLRDMAGGPLPRLAALKQQFAMTRGIGPNTNDTTLVVDLKPLDQKVATYLASVQVTIDKSVPCVTQIIMTDPEGETTTVTFTEIRRDTGLTDADVALVVPSETKESRPLGPAEAEQSPKDSAKPVGTP
jgi:hypothetical protein